MIRVSEKIKRKWILRKELSKYKKFLNECTKESKKLNEIKEFTPELRENFLKSLSASDPIFILLIPLLDNYYNDLCRKMQNIIGHIIELLSWINVYKKTTKKEEKLHILIEEIEDYLTLTFDSLYSYKEKLINALAMISGVCQRLIDKPTGWKIDDKKTNIEILRKYFCHIESINKLLPKIEKLHQDFQRPPLDFRHKDTHRITPGVELYRGQCYSLKIDGKGVRVGLKRGEKVELKKVEEKVKKAYCECVDLFYGFEDYLIDYLKVKEKIKFK